MTPMAACLVLAASTAPSAESQPPQPRHTVAFANGCFALPSGVEFVLRRPARGLVSLPLEDGRTVVSCEESVSLADRVPNEQLTTRSAPHEGVILTYKRASGRHGPELYVQVGPGSCHVSGMFMGSEEAALRALLAVSGSFATGTCRGSLKCWRGTKSESIVCQPTAPPESAVQVDEQGVPIR